MNQLAYDPNNLEEMLLVEAALKEARNFWVRQQDWPRVSVIKRKLKSCERQIVNLRLRPQMEAA